MVERTWNPGQNTEESDNTMITIRFILLSLVVAGFATIIYTIVRRTRNLETRQIDKDLSAWESEGGNLAPSGALVEPGSVVSPDTNKRQS